MTTIFFFAPNYSNLFELKNFVQKKAQFYGDELKVIPILKQKESLLSSETNEFNIEHLSFDEVLSLFSKT